MSIACKKLSTTMLLGLGILLCIFGIVSITKLAQKGSEGQLPTRTLIITIDPSQRDEFFIQMKSFAEKHSIKIVIRDVEVKIGPSGKGFFVEMHRSDIQIVAIGEPSNPMVVSIAFYDEDPTYPVPKATLDDLFDDLQSFMLEIPNVTITEEK